MKTLLIMSCMAFLTPFCDAPLDAATPAVLPAPLPEFMNQEQLAKWTADQEAAAAKETASAPESANQFFTGKPYVANAGGYVFKYRTYNPEMSRWTSADPSGYPDGANDKFYAPNPVSSLDQLGLLSIINDQVQAQLNSYVPQVQISAQNALQVAANFILGLSSNILDVEATATGTYSGSASGTGDLDALIGDSWLPIPGGASGQGSIATTALTPLTASASGNTGPINNTATVSTSFSVYITPTFSMTFSPPISIFSNLRLDGISNGQVTLTGVIQATFTIYSE